MENDYRCKKCHWEGSQDQLEVDVVETCFGNDQIEMCPTCGSFEIVKNGKHDVTPGAKKITPNI